MRIHVIEEDQYFGTVNKREIDLPDGLTPPEVWLGVYEACCGVTPEEGGGHDRPNTKCSEGYLEDWEAYGSHHAGMVTRVWWGEGAEQAATAKHDELQQDGSKEDRQQGMNAERQSRPIGAIERGPDG